MQTRLRRSRSSHVSLAFEPLEARHVLSASLVISELLASNREGLRDEDGDSSDWIEIHNRSDIAVNLDGWHLTDTDDDLTKWTFGAYLLDPGEYLVVFASSKDRSAVPPDGEFHTNFNLAATGEFVAIVRPDGATIEHAFAPSYPPQQTDIAFGIDPAFPDSGPYYYATPTPGGENGIGAVGFAGEPVASVPRGFYATQQLVTLASQTPAATIRYTLDGSTPTQSHGTIFTGGFLVNQSTTLRAVAYRTDYLPSDVATNTYLFADDIVTQSPGGAPPPGWAEGSVNGQILDYGMDPDIVGGRYSPQEVVASLMSIPSVSLVTDVEHLLDTQTGIYVNAGGRGKFWERPASVELIHPDGTDGFQVDAGLRIRGGFSRSDNNPKHSFRLFFDNDYDGRLVYPLFGNEGASEFANIDLRTAQNYSWAFSASSEASFSREVFSRDSQRDMGHEYTRSRYYHLYLNGQYWGLFQTQERSEADFAASYFGGDSANYDVIKSTGSPGGYTIEATDGSMDAWARLWELAVELDTGPIAFADNYWTMQGLYPDGSRNESIPALLDVENLVEYMVLVFYTGNSDAPLSNFIGNNRPNNWFGIYNRVNQDRGFQFFAHDSEHTLGTSGSRNDRTGPFEFADGFDNERTLSYSNPQFLHQHLMNHEAYRLKFADRAQRLLLTDGVLTAASSTARYAARVEQVAPAVLAESARWGDSKRPDNPYSIPDWEAQVDEVFGFFNGRSETVIEQLRQDDLFPPLDAPIFNSTGGMVAENFPLRMANPNGDGLIYYTANGADPRRTDGGVDNSAVVYNGTTTRTTLLPAGSVWSYLDDGSNQGTAWRNPSFDDSAWSTGAAQLGYGDGDEVTVVNFVDADPFADGVQKNPTTYFRTSFTVGDVSDLVNQTLRLKRDDGAAVYINGQEVVRSNLPGAIGAPLEHHRTALALVAGENESTFYRFTIPATMLVAGENTIAVEVHQLSPTSSDISFDLELIGNRVTPAIPITESGTVQARVFDDGLWSPLTAVTFAVDTVPADATNLRITEINYHPSPPTGAELAIDATLQDNDFEFVELRNFGSHRIDLTGVEFVEVGGEGPAFDFSSASIIALAPGESLLLVEDTDAFAIRYGDNLPVAGQWSGRLSNGGELITVLDASGATIHAFAYDDEGGWPTPPDGEGPTLVVLNPFGDYQSSSNWRSSFTPLGTPGVFERLAGDFDSDGDADGDDFLLWQAGYTEFTSGATTADGDADADGDVDGDDFLLWQASYVAADGTGAGLDPIRRGRGDQTLKSRARRMALLPLETNLARTQIASPLRDGHRLTSVSWA